MPGEDDGQAVLCVSVDQRLEVGENGRGAGDEGVRFRIEEVILHIKDEQGGVQGCEGRQVPPFICCHSLEHFLGCVMDRFRGEISLFHR